MHVGTLAQATDVLEVAIEVPTNVLGRDSGTSHALLHHNHDLPDRANIFYIGSAMRTSDY